MQILEELWQIGGVKKSYGLGDETASEPGAAVPSAGRQQAEQFMAGVMGVDNDPVGLLPTQSQSESSSGTDMSFTEDMLPSDNSALIS